MHRSTLTANRSTGRAALGAVLSALLLSAPAQAATADQPAPAPLTPRSADAEANRDAPRFILIPGRGSRIVLRSDAPMGELAGGFDTLAGTLTLEPNIPTSAPARADSTKAAEAAEADTDADSENNAEASADPPAPLAALTITALAGDIAMGPWLPGEHLAGPGWLDAAAHPAVRFTLARCEDMRTIDADPSERTADAGPRTFTATLVGDIVIAGVTRSVRIPNAVIRLHRANAAGVGSADTSWRRVELDAAVRLDLERFGIDHPLLGRLVARKIDVQLTAAFEPAPPHEANEESSESPTASEPTADE